MEKQQNQNPMSESIEDLKKIKEVVSNSAKDTEAVKEGVVSEEEKKKEPSFVLFDAIAESSISILQTEGVLTAFQGIAPVLGKEGTKSLIDLITIIMTQSSYYAILQYDEMLKSELDKHFDNIVNNINICKSDLDAYKATLQVFSRSLNEIKKKLQIDDFIKENNVE